MKKLATLLQRLNPVRWAMRHFFAGCAIPAVVAAQAIQPAYEGETVGKAIKRRCYEIADAMLQGGDK